MMCPRRRWKWRRRKRRRLGGASWFALSSASSAPSILDVIIFLQIFLLTGFQGGKETHPTELFGRRIWNLDFTEWHTKTASTKRARNDLAGCHSPP